MIISSINKIVLLIVVLCTLFLTKVGASFVLSSRVLNDYVLQQQKPIPPGGMEEFRKWISKNYILPKEAKLNKVEGKIVLSFFIEKDGALEGIKIKGDLGYGTGEAAVNLFKKSDRLTPAMRNGKPVRSFYEFPVVIPWKEDKNESSLQFLPKVEKREVVEGKSGENEDSRELAIKPAYNNSDTTIYESESAEVLPEPPGGKAAFNKWIGKNYQYPQGAVDVGAKGTIIIEFIVEKDGSLTDIKVKKDLGYGTGSAAVNLLKRAKKWSPGIQKGRPVRVIYSLPIVLNISNM